MPGTITIAAGLRNMTGEYDRVRWSTAAELGEAIEEHDANMEDEGWWSPHVFRGPRDGKNWVQSCALAIDIDGPTKKDKQPLPDPLREQLEDLFLNDRGPGSVHHVTHSGFRIVYALQAPTRSKEAWLRAHAWARAHVAAWMRQQGIDGFEVDRAVANLANLNWLANTTDEKGRSRQATVYAQERLFNIAEMQEVAEEDARVPEMKEHPPATLRDKQKSLDAVLALGPKACDEYETWLEVGQVLHLVWGGSRVGLDVWHEWSKTGSNYDPKALDKRWVGFKPGGRGLGSLIFLAKTKATPGGWEGGRETLHEMGLHPSPALISRTVEAPPIDDDWVERMESREEASADAGGTFRLDSLDALSERIHLIREAEESGRYCGGENQSYEWFPLGPPAPRG